MQGLAILLVQLGSNGDCLFVTTLARQIKEIDYPGCHLTWMIASSYKQVIENNPYVDEIFEIDAPTREAMIEQRSKIPELINEAGQRRKYHEVFVTDFSHNVQNWYGTTRSCLFRNYPKRIVTDIRPDIFLTESEISNVRNFCTLKDIRQDTLNILMESSPQSGQSRMTTETALEMAKELIKKFSNLRIVISTKEGIPEEHPCIIDGSVLTWKENAELINHCNLLVGCSSGISWLGTSRYCKTIPSIQNIDPGYWGGKMSVSFIDDYRFFNADSSHIIELHNPEISTLQQCIESVLNNGIQKTKRKYRDHVGAIFVNKKFLNESYMTPRQKQTIKRILFFKEPYWALLNYMDRVKRFALRSIK